jgi:hypothetical protein
VLQLPLIVLLEQYRADQPDDRGLIGEDANDVGAALDFLVEPFERIGAMQFAAVLLGKIEVGQHLGLAVIDEGGAEKRMMNLVQKLLEAPFMKEAALQLYSKELEQLETGTPEVAVGDLFSGRSISVTAALEPATAPA